MSDPSTPSVPTVNVPASIYDPALAWCNERRRAKGLEAFDALPAGLKGDCASCPCATATGVYVGAYCWEEQRGPTPFADKCLLDYEKHGLRFPSYFDGHVSQYGVLTLPVRVPDEVAS